MKTNSLTIAGVSVDLSKAWVHLQEAQPSASSYRFVVPKSQATQVFDPHVSKQHETAWTEYISRLIEDFGTYIVEAFFDNALGLDGASRSGVEWVIASVDHIEENADFIVITGKAVGFEEK